MKFLIDECLSPQLVTVAQDYSYIALAARDVNLLGAPDWRVTQWAVEHDFILVTRNAIDFRGKDKQSGHYGRQEIHPGLICLDALNVFDGDTAALLFERALMFLDDRKRLGEELINQVLDVIFDGVIIHTALYDLPPI